jgi:hypothetical protein
MTVTLDQLALYEAQEAFWNAEQGNDKGVEAAITAYLTRMRLARHHETVLAENDRMRARVGARQISTLQAAE